MITPMKRVLLAGRPADRDALLQVLQNAGVIHVEPAAGKPEIPTDLNREIQRIQKAIEILQEYKTTDEGIATPGTPSRLTGEIHAAAQRLTDLDAELIALELEKDRVAPWGNIDHEALQALRAAGFTVDFLDGLAGFEQELAAADCLQTICLRDDGRQYVVAVSRSPLPVPPGVTRTETPPRDAGTIADLLQEHRQERKALLETLRHQTMRLPDLEQHLAERLERKSFAEVEASLHKDEQLFVLQGWIPAADTGKLSEALERAKVPAGLDFADPSDEHQPPTKFDNPWWCKPVEYLYEFLGIIPGYREPDITPTFFPAMVLFAGMLVADAGYATIALIGLIASYKTLMKQGFPMPLLHLLLSMMAGTFLYGAATNAWFGEPMNRYISFGDSRTMDTKVLQHFCFVLGAVHLTIAHIWKARCRPLDWYSLSDLGWVLFIWAMYALVCVLVLQHPIPFYMKPFFIVSILLIIFFTAPSWNLFSAAGAGLGDFLLNSIAFFSDIISYIRLWAVGLAGGVLGHSFNELARPMPLLLCLIILLAGHTLNFILSMIAVLAHGVRLNLLEFSNHLGMEWTGREYQPFRKK